MTLTAEVGVKAATNGIVTEIATGIDGMGLRCVMTMMMTIEATAPEAVPVSSCAAAIRSFA